MSSVIGWILKVVGLGLAALGVFVGHKIYKIKSDNFIEEIVEQKIEEETGIEVDLSPEDPDPDTKPSKI